MMAVNVQCKTCGVFIYKGTKFNMRKENVLGEDYLGIQIYRFYFRCPKCSSEITFKTDPQKSDYIMEHGARATEPWKVQDATIFSQKVEKEHEDAYDVINDLENQTIDSKQEMETLKNLEYMRIMQEKQNTLGVEKILESVYQRAEREERISE